MCTIPPSPQDRWHRCAAVSQCAALRCDSEPHPPRVGGARMRQHAVQFSARTAQNRSACAAVPAPYPPCADAARCPTAAAAATSGRVQGQRQRASDRTSLQPIARRRAAAVPRLSLRRRCAAAACPRMPADSLGSGSRRGARAHRCSRGACPQTGTERPALLPVSRMVSWNDPN